MAALEEMYAQNQKVKEGILAPPSATSVAIAEITSNFPHRRLIIFLGSSASSRSAVHSSVFPSSGRDLEKFILGLDILNLDTANIIIVTSYSTAAARFLRSFQITNAGDQYPLKRISEQECRERDPPIDFGNFEELY
ncbi:hypothetical protein LTR37_021146 [Vermiconidia calcicola]|uniref:Uncharacterized protein n=1 Tax=Vermiconidia calcicola TaxID=1690605 RepID=A0ACC3MB91_9PEZI|nr:hypothetical protein LTR37_021146 [Vermiconidia calcicola]